MSKYKIVQTGKFWKDLKTIKKRGYDLALIGTVIDMIALGEQLPEKYKDHALTGNFLRCRECHITPDWLLVYEQDDEKIILYLTRTGSHSDLF